MPWKRRGLPRAAGRPGKGAAPPVPKRLQQHPPVTPPRDVRAANRQRLAEALARRERELP
jgi:hypothetical protein